MKAIKIDDARFIHEEHMIAACGNVSLSAYWNSEKAWAELAVYTPWETWGHRWEGVQNFGSMLTQGQGHVFYNLMREKRTTELDAQGTASNLSALNRYNAAMLVTLSQCETETEFRAIACRLGIDSGDVNCAIVLKPTREAIMLQTHVMPLIHAMGESIMAGYPEPNE